MFENLFDKKIDAYIIFNPVNRFYLTEFNSSFGCVFLAKNENIFFTDSRYTSEAKQNIVGYDVRQVNGGNLYESIVAELKRIDAKTVGYEDKYFTVYDFKNFKNALNDFNLKPASDILEAERIIKTDAEIEKIKDAQKIAEKSLKKIVTQIRVGMTERDLSRELMFECLANGAEGMSFDTIICFGENSANPHHSPSDRRFEKNDIILIDFGVKYNGYCSDMTRTFYLGEPDEKLAVIHDIVLGAQNYALKHIKAGMTAREADSLAREYIRSNGYGDEFGHSLGHGVGIEIHEAPRLSENASDVILTEGMVVTIEPGIYVEGLGGVRIEDMGVITSDGFENFTDFDKNIEL